LTISYPAESFSIELHIVVMVVATIVTVVGLILGSVAKGRAANVQSNWDAIVKDIIPISGVILAFAGPIITAVFNPVLDYTVSEDTKNNIFQVKINNYGLVAAKKIEVNFNSLGNNFLKFSSMPLINGNTYLTSEKLKQEGSGLFLIPALPSRSETTISAQFQPNLSNNHDVTVYVRSETSTGVHNIIPLIIAYLAYAIVLTFDAAYIILNKWDIGKTEKIVLAVVNVIAIVVIFCILYFGACEMSGNCLSAGITK
jgi:hypothetical protein